jgi:hypothetical protein
MPSLIAQAAAPSIGAVLLEMGGLDGALETFLAVAAFNALLVICLFLMLPAASAGQQTSGGAMPHRPMPSR